MAVYVGSASIDENGRAHGGRAGNQTGRELKRQKWYAHSKGWRVFRAKDAAAAERIARCMAAAVENRHIGYDQYQRNTLYAEAAKVGFDVSRVAVDCETDCSALVRVCCAYAGITGLPAGFRTTNEPANLLKTGAFVELTDAKYTKRSAYLKAGDILCTATQGHTVVVLNDGSRAKKVPAARETGVELLGARVLRKGRSGADVRQMQEALIALGYSCGIWGADGDFGDATDAALRAFQRDRGLEADGQFGPRSLAALKAALGL